MSATPNVRFPCAKLPVSSRTPLSSEWINLIYSRFDEKYCDQRPRCSSDLNGREEPVISPGFDQLPFHIQEPMGEELALFSQRG